MGRVKNSLLAIFLLVLASSIIYVGYNYLQNNLVGGRGLVSWKIKVDMSIYISNFYSVYPAVLDYRVYPQYSYNSVIWGFDLVRREMFSVDVGVENVSVLGSDGMYLYVVRSGFNRYVRGSYLYTFDFSGNLVSNVSLGIDISEGVRLRPIINGTLYFVQPYYDFHNRKTYYNVCALDVSGSGVSWSISIVDEYNSSLVGVYKIFFVGGYLVLVIFSENRFVNVWRIDRFTGDVKWFVRSDFEYYSQPGLLDYRVVGDRIYFTYLETTFLNGSIFSRLRLVAVDVNDGVLWSYSIPNIGGVYITRYWNILSILDANEKYVVLYVDKNEPYGNFSYVYVGSYILVFNASTGLLIQNITLPDIMPFSKYLWIGRRINVVGDKIFLVWVSKDWRVRVSIYDVETGDVLGEEVIDYGNYPLIVYSWYIPEKNELVFMYSIHRPRQVYFVGLRV